MQTKQTLNMTKFADHIIAVAKENKLPITNLQLQKVMYFTLKLAKEDEILKKETLVQMYNQPFEIKRFGPVVQEQYKRFQFFASEFIIGSFEQTPLLKPLNSIILELLKVNTFTLVDISTRLPFWIQNHQKTDNFTKTIEYQFEDI